MKLINGQFLILNMLKTSIYHNKIILILGFVNSPTLKLCTPGQRHGKKIIMILKTMACGLAILNNNNVKLNDAEKLTENTRNAMTMNRGESHSGIVFIAHLTKLGKISALFKST